MVWSTSSFLGSFHLLSSLFQPLASLVLTRFFLLSSLFLECPSLQYPTSNPHLLQAYFKCLLFCKVFCDLFYLLVTDSPSLKSYTPLSSYLPLVGSPWGSLRACFIFVHSRPSTHCGTLCM